MCLSNDGIETDSKKVSAINEWPVPRTVTGVEFLRFYQLLLAVYTKTCSHSKTINQLVSGENANKKKSLAEWTAECQQAFK